MITGIAIPPNAQSLDISGPLDVFVEANRHLAPAAAYDVRLISATATRGIRASGMTIQADLTFRDADFPIDTLLVAGTPDYRQAGEMTGFLSWLRSRTPDMRRFGSVCTGAFFLGAAGLLDDRQVTTHWQHAPELAKLYPKAQISDDAIYVQDGPLYTSAGVTAGIDLALKLVEIDHGRELALKVARRLVVFLRRPGGQSQFSAHLAAQIAEESRIRSVQRWILRQVSADLSLKRLAAHCGMSVRNFTRVFLSETGQTPGDFVERARVDAARRLLEDSDTPLQRVATQCGFSNPDIMRRAFLRRIGTGPSEYRRTFRQR